MRHRPRLILIFGLLSLACSTGCLSIGGKTYTTTDTPETLDRISALEGRVVVLEQTVSGKTPVPTANTTRRNHDEVVGTPGAIGPAVTSRTATTAQY